MQQSNHQSPDHFKVQFDSLGLIMPIMPNVSECDRKIRQIKQVIQQSLNIGSVLVESNEPKIVIKQPANYYQKTVCKENYAFLFQSLLDGRTSQFLRKEQWPLYHITEQDRQDGGIFPDKLPIDGNNIDVVFRYYRNILEQTMIERSNMFQSYYNQLRKVNIIWWELYNHYIKSNAWNLKRNKRLEIDNNTCQMCGSVDNLQVHHWHYNNVGDEKMGDLMTVCKSCHSKLHPNKQL